MPIAKEGALTPVSDEPKLMKVLICDDDPQDRKLVRTLLRQQTDTEIATLEAGETADIQAALAKSRVDLVIMDIQMPDKSGMEWLKEIVGQQLAPVVMLTGFGNEEMAVASLEQGAVGYLAKGNLSAEKLHAAVATATKRWRDIQLTKANQEELERIVNLDALTGIPNRRAISKKLEDAIAHTSRYLEQLSVILLDLDRFKDINDTYGHITGDDVLDRIGALLRTRIRGADSAGRYGGDEFLIVLPNTDWTAAAMAAERVRQLIAGYNMRDAAGNIFHVTVSQGVTSHQMGDDSRSLISRADEALYLAKQHGRNRVEVCQPNSVEPASGAAPQQANDASS